MIEHIDRQTTNRDRARRQRAETEGKQRDREVERKRLREIETETPREESLGKQAGHFYPAYSWHIWRQQQTLLGP